MKTDAMLKAFREKIQLSQDFIHSLLKQ